jgi:type VI protein secretion system component VasK
MNKLAAFFKNPIVLSGLLLLVLIVLIWFLSPSMGLTRTDLRLFIILGLIMLWVILALLLKSRQSGAMAAAGMAGAGASIQAPYVQPPTIQPPYIQPPSMQPPYVQPPAAQMLGVQYSAPTMPQANLQISPSGTTPMTNNPPEQLEEITAFRGQLERALQWLRGSKIAKTGAGDIVYRMPWYLVLGPSASGKSLLLNQSGLNFPYTDPDRAMGKRGIEPDRKSVV